MRGGEVGKNDSAEMDFDSIGLGDLSDQPRQKILTKANFPRDCVAIIQKVEKIQFSRKEPDSKPVLKFHLKFLIDLQGAKCIRKGFDFSETTHLFCAPARFQPSFVLFTKLIVMLENV